ncbi:MAG: autotransporter outer membrane beta-barrel domain-containing protein, partial [Asticcacaulis sp.]|nr:autotransporter outer membrane beta-barrel domain-containing protein [Asticcacaulis sp.]
VNVTAAIAFSKGNPLALGVGGSGGTGGNGGVVEVSQGWEDVNGVKTATPGTLRTYGEGSIALLAQSVGGGGGDAGFNLVVPVTYSGDPKEPAKAAVISVGGSGAGAGYGDTVTVDHRGNIITGYLDGPNGVVGGKGNDSGGILAQSVGGGGGNANLNLGLGITRNASALALAVGGDTGAAGKGGKVNVYHDGNIYTWGNDSTAITAQSIGGGGGNTAASIGLPALANDKLEISIGRRGGTGGEGDEVYVDAKGTLSTQGERSDGVFAQSVGGGGGRSGTTAVGGQLKDSGNNETVGGKVTVGLEGGEGAISKKVEVHAAGYVDTWGKDSYGIHAQSIGGGGGVGGLASNTIMRTNGSLNMAIGGDGGKGAKGGEVKVYNAAVITTRGENAAGIFAQSIGGGGGTGGNVGTLGIPAGGPKEQTPHMNLALSVGGSGGEGATGNTVYVENSGIITTSGKHAAGIRAESIGGGGGFGGTILSFRADTAKGSSQTMAINIGGDGGTGGVGDTVTVWNKGGSIWTDGEWSAGISAASIGGGGGEGGGVADFQAAAITGDGTYGNITVNMGGKGGQGGKGGEVNVTNDPTAGVGGTGQIVTTKDNSYGIFAQSLGGGGGNGGSVFSVTGGKGSKDSVSLGVNIGGSGDDGGTGGHVNVINRGLIDTTGNSAHGILAQSIGGGGGNGAMAIAGALLISAPTKSPLIAIGGSGGDGGDSGLVEVNNSGTIVTRGKNANGIFAQSIGGGGGNSTTGFSLSGNPYTFVGSNALAALIGALTTGNGGIGGEVKVTNTGSITTLGEGSAGIVGESINGGGGHLVLNFDSIETLFDLQCIPIPGASTCIPGTGGTTGERPVGQPIYSTTLGSTDSSDMNAGKVTIVNTGTIASGGANSVGMAIRSVGGGGGKIDVHSLLATTSTPDNPHLTMPVTFGVNLGALNAKNGTGSVIDSKQTGTIYTAAGNATGLRLQSIGGGGGDSLIDLDAPDGTQISTVDVKLGATNGSHLEGGAVGHIQDGAIVTTGAWSTAAHIQSIGGGGGTAMVDINAVDQSQLVTRAVLGADGGANLKAEAVTGSYDGLQTDGDHSVALLAQSIGGGGGAVMTTGSHALDVKLGGTNGAAGDGGSINLSNDGLIQAGGAGSHGVLLQSIGGGGGAVLTDATSITVGLNNGNSGNGGAITFGETGNIVTTGAGGYGLIAQSLGGGGGWVDGPDGNSFAGAAGGTGQGGAITLTLDGGVFASGTGATAIFAQSLGSLGGGNIALTTDGLVRGNAAGIVFNGGAANTITANGSVSAVSGLAINTGSGDDKVINTGLVVGNIDLGSGANAFNNQAGATFVAISTIDLSDPSGGNNSKLAPNAVGLPTVNGTFSNDGDFLMGLSAPRIPIDLAKGATFANLDAQGAPASNLMYGTRVINTVDLDGSFVQSASGHLVFDVAFGPYASDRVNVTGNATVAGTGDVTLTWLENAAPVTLFATAGTATDNGLNIKDTLALDYRIVTDKDGVKLAFTSDFAQPFLNRNERELGHHMDSAISLGGSGGIGRLMALIGNLQQGDETVYEGIFQELNPEPFLAPQLIQLGSARQFAGDLNYCDAAGNAPEHCVWGRLASSDTSRKGDSESFAYHGTLDGFETGFEKRVDDKWSVSGALGYDDLGRLTAGNGRAQFEGDSVHGGFGATRTFATGTKLDLSLTGGLQTVESERLIQVFGPTVATATPHSSYVMANARVSRQYDHGSLFARPAVSLALTSLRQGAFTEQGADGLGAAGVAHTQTFATLTPDFTVGYQSRDAAGTYTALSLSIGAAIHSTDRVKMPYRLAGANPNADPAWISTALDPSTVRYGANLQVVGQDDKASLNLSIATENGKRFSQQTFSLSARLKF